MITHERLRQEQPIVYQTLKNGLEKKQMAHAYLFVGPVGTPRLDTAKLLLQSILCEHDGFACGKCTICQRIENASYFDMLLLDGEKSSIKKEQVMKLREQFSKTGLESYDARMYIINACENMTAEAMNALLKFLEEPSSTQIYAVLITSQADRLLDTIVSRCQNITFRPLSLERCLEESKALGVSEEDAQLLCRIIRDCASVKLTAQEECYQIGKQLAVACLEAYVNHPIEGGYAFQQLVKQYKDFDKQAAVWMLEVMIVFFQEVITTTFCSQNSIWNDSVVKARGLHNIPGTLKALLESKDTLQRYPNLQLLIDQLFYKMLKGA